jgi:hypothetical protein
MTVETLIALTVRRTASGGEGQMIAVRFALDSAFSAGSLLAAVSSGVCQADREDLAARPARWSALLAHDVLRLYVRKNEPACQGESKVDSGDHAVA